MSRTGNFPVLSLSSFLCNNVSSPSLLPFNIPGILFYWILSRFLMVFCLCKWASKNPVYNVMSLLGKWNFCDLLYDFMTKATCSTNRFFCSFYPWIYNYYYTPMCWCLAWVALNLKEVLNWWPRYIRQTAVQHFKSLYNYVRGRPLRLNFLVSKLLYNLQLCPLSFQNDSHSRAFDGILSEYNQGLIYLQQLILQKCAISPH